MSIYQTWSPSPPKKKKWKTNPTYINDFSISNLSRGLSVWEPEKSKRRLCNSLEAAFNETCGVENLNSIISWCFNCSFQSEFHIKLLLADHRSFFSLSLSLALARGSRNFQSFWVFGFPDAALRTWWWCELALKVQYYHNWTDHVYDFSFFNICFASSLFFREKLQFLRIFMFYKFNNYLRYQPTQEWYRFGIAFYDSILIQ